MVDGKGEGRVLSSSVKGYQTASCGRYRQILMKLVYTFLLLKHFARSSIVLTIFWNSFNFVLCTCEIGYDLSVRNRLYHELHKVYGKGHFLTVTAYCQVEYITTQYSRLGPKAHRVVTCRWNQYGLNLISFYKIADR